MKQGFPLAVAALLALALPLPAEAQSPTPSMPTENFQGLKFRSGQSVTPFFEGWVKNADGTFDLVFGYFNRNYEQEFAIPVGPDNLVEPGRDRGQPTYFLPRRQRFMYRVRVPADFGKQEMVWTLTANGRTERAYGSLRPDMELLERHLVTGRFDPGLNDPTQPPTLAVTPVAKARAGQPVTLSAAVTDDGLPGAVDKQARPLPGGDNKVALTVRWVQYGGPGKAAFESSRPVTVANGRAVTTVRFEKPGNYALIAYATDGSMTTQARVDVQVEPGQ